MYKKSVKHETRCEKRIIKLVSKKLNRKALDALPRSSKDTKKKRWIRMSFLGELSTKLSKQLRPLGFHPAFYTVDSIMSVLCDRKDRIYPQDRKGVYILPRDSCNAVYIGETGRQFQVRLHEHLNQKPLSSAFSKHLTGESVQTGLRKASDAF